MNTTDHAAAIRQTLKARYGWSSRQVSVRADYYSMGSAIRVTIKDAAVMPSTVEAVAKQAESIDYCQVTGEILSGGNRFVTVSYDQDVLTAFQVRWIGAIDAAYIELVAETQERPTALVEIPGTPYRLGYDNTHRGFSLWRDGHQGNYYDLPTTAQALGRKMADEMAVPALKGVH